MYRSLIIASAIAICSKATAQLNYVPGDILVMVRSGQAPENITADLRTLDGATTDLRVVKQLSAPMRIWLLHYSNAAITQERMLRAVQAHRATALAQNNHITHDRAIPNDPQYGQQWQHQNIHSEGAWDITTGGVTITGDTIVVCIMEAADLPHPDLIGNAWYNFHEIPGNGIDDDGNGYVDDFRGWDITTNTDAAYGGSHGTEVAGMIGAKGNNGNEVVGANWNVKLMVVKRTDVTESGVITAYTYPLIMRRLYNHANGAQGAFIVATNASWGIDNANPADYPLWCAMYDTLGTAGVLNCGATANNNVNIDVVGDMPTGCASDFMVSVTATDINDMRTFSGYGVNSIDVGAPGSNIFTTQIGGGTGSASGTSFASPLTAGVIALLYSVPCSSLMSLVHNDPMQGALYVRQALFNGVDQVGNLPGNTVTGGRINAANSTQWIVQQCGVCSAPFDLAANSGPGADSLVWSSNSSSLFNVRYRPTGTADWTTVDNVTTTSLNISGVPFCTPYEFQVQALCDTTTSSYTPSFTWTSAGCCVAPIIVSAAPIDSASASVDWSSVLTATTYDLRYRPQGSSIWTEMDGLVGTATVLNGLQSCTAYEAQMRSTCNGNNADWSASILFSTPGCGQCTSGTFCPGGGTNTQYEWIARVQVGSIDHTSGANNGYVAFTDQVTDLVVGQPTPITVTPAFGGGAYFEHFTVWIDMDHNGQFASPAEVVYDSGDSANAAVTGNLLVPLGTAPGSARMRVTMSFQDAVVDGCTAYQFGEAEDYCVVLQTANGIAPVTEGGVRVYPVPASDAMYIEWRGKNGNDAALEVSDAMGRIVEQRRVKGDRATLDVSAFLGGLYFFRIVSSDGTALRGRFEVAR